MLESINDGTAVDDKYNSQKLYFKKPNVLIGFAKREPNQNIISEDIWTIFKISNHLTKLDDIAGVNLCKKKG